ncbi:maestro heat-like repeat-containing protein family member 6 [Manacus candei]|uniref:maestro heat-like repeat-containing protein family member 6 n=1 Tax=Manacus candei TaxID=415023 RepID=UPI0022279B10|nr:maestro heat-like repeat-containing protein family member 6 [Manacus candei]
MAGGCFGLCRLLRRKRKNRRGPGAGPAQEPEEEVQHFQPLQQDPGRDRPEEQDRARGRLHRAVQRLLKFIGVRRRTATTAPPELPAQPDTSAAELEAEPDVSTAPRDCAASGDMALTDGTATSDMAVTDGTDTTTMAAIDCTANCGTDISDQTLVNGTANLDMAPLEGTEATDTAPLQATATSDTALMDGTATFDTALTDAETSSDTAPTDVGAKADATTESIADTDCLPMDSVTDAPSLDIWEEKTVSNVNEVSSLWPGLELPRGLAAPQAGSAGPSEPLRPAQCGGKGSPSCGKLGNLLALATLQVSPTPLQVPAIVRSIHQWLTCRVSPEVRPPIAIRWLAHAHPGHVVTTLLHCAPACDRAAAILWRTIASSATTAHEVLPTLLGVMEDWPLHSVCTSNGDHVDVFALAATLALWLMVQELQCQDALFVYAPRLLLALLCQVSMSTEQMPQEVSTFWRGCQELHGLPTHPNSFVVQTIRALLCRLQWDQELVSVERKRGWDALLSADTHHYAVGLLAREMRHVLVPSYGPLARHLLGLLSTEGPRWELPALAFLVEVLDYLDVNTRHDSVLQILARHLQSQCPERRRLALRGLLVLSGDPSMAKSICSLSEPLLELLRDGDGELVRMTLSVFRNVLQDEEDRKGLSSTAPRLTEALRPVFDNDNSHVQLLSIRLFREVMEVLAEEGTEPWEMQVRQSLVPLFFRWHDENQRVAEAAREALLWATSFLHRKDLEQLLKTEQPFRFCDYLMEKDRSRRGEHLQQALPYLQSPQEPLREAAVRFMGVAGWHMREWQQDLWPILKGLTAMSDDDCPSVSNIRTTLMDTYSRAMRRPMSLQQPCNSPGTTSRHGCTTS